MALSDSKILKIKVDYESGKLSKTQIGNVHKVSQPTIRKLAATHDWVFQKNFQEISEIVEQKSIERIIEVEVDKTVKENDNFQSAVNRIEFLVMKYIKELEELQESIDKESKTKEEADRIFSFLKSCKISSEIMNMNYNGKRKMLGMDREDDIRKAKAIKSGIEEKAPDPVGNLSEDEIDKQLEALNE